MIPMPIQLVDLGLYCQTINCLGRFGALKIENILPRFRGQRCTRVQDPKKGFLCQPKRDKCIKSCQPTTTMKDNNGNSNNNNDNNWGAYKNQKWSAKRFFFFCFQ